MDFLEDDPTRAWRLRSNSGRELWLVHRADELRRGTVVYRSLLTGCDVDDLLYVSGTVTGMSVAPGTIDRFRRRVAAYLSAPDPFELHLTEGVEPELHFSLGPQPGIISSLDQPVAAIRMATSRATFELSFVVDQSCLRLLLEDLEALLGGLLADGS